MEIDVTCPRCGLEGPVLEIEDGAPILFKFCVCPGCCAPLDLRSGKPVLVSLETVNKLTTEELKLFSEIIRRLNADLN